MKKLFVLTSLFFITFNLMAQTQEEMKAWQDFMTPGPMHQMLQTTVGDWNAEITMWMDANTPPTTSKGTYKTEAILGGRYFQTKHNASMMGMPMEGLQIIGYDNGVKKFFAFWIDNFGTGYLHLDGTYDESTKSITFAGTGTDQYGKEYKMREIVKPTDNNSGVIEMYTDMGTGEFKSMEIKYTRQ